MHVQPQPPQKVVPCDAFATLPYKKETKLHDLSAELTIATCLRLFFSDYFYFLLQLPMPDINNAKANPITKF